MATGKFDLGATPPYRASKSSRGNVNLIGIVSFLLVSGAVYLLFSCTPIHTNFEFKSLIGNKHGGCHESSILTLEETLGALVAECDEPEVNPAIEYCPQYPAIKPEDEEFSKKIHDLVNSESFRDLSIKRLSGAIQIPTQSFDELIGPLDPKDPRWQPFLELHEYFAKTFPHVHRVCKMEKINTFALLYTWEGSDPSLKPMVLMAHQDVVPVLAETRHLWKYEPFSGHFDGEYVWGRGAADCKNTLVSSLEAVEYLASEGFKPKRTIILSYGYDEEITGFNGAKFLAKHLEEKYGKNSIEFIVDEGSNVMEQYGKTFAVPSTSEKGYIDVEITVSGAGGHSSVPPDHTAIGVLAKVITLIESNQYEPMLTPANPVFSTLQCGAEFGEMPDQLRKQIKLAATNKNVAKALAKYLAQESLFTRYLLQTSQAVDIVRGGHKVNALPESVYAVVNHRVAIESKVQDVRDHILNLLKENELSNEHTMTAWDTEINSGNKFGFNVTIKDSQVPLEPAPVSPNDSFAYKLLSGTIKHIWGDDTIVAPAIMTGNTDTKYYWDLAKDIYRFTPCKGQLLEMNVHTVNERIPIAEHIVAIEFYIELIR